jgi:hypothetical protein
MSTPPSQSDIATVQTNLTNLWHITNYVHGMAIDDINTCYLLQTQPQTDTGQGWASVLIQGAIWAGAEIPIPGINAGIGLLSGVVQQLLTNPPINYPSTFADVWERFDASFLNVETTIADLNSGLSDPDPTVVQTNWDSTFTGSDGTQYTVSGLLGTAVPPVATADFMSICTGMLTAFTYNLWKATLKTGWVIYVLPTEPILLDQPQSWNPGPFTNVWVTKHPAYYLTFEWYDNPTKSCCTGGGVGYNMTEKWIGQNASGVTDGAAPASLCAFLMQDDGCGTILNPGAITSRMDVFTTFGLATEVYYFPVRSVAGPNAPGKTIQELLETSTRQELEARVYEAVLDPMFRAELLRRPKRALYDLLGLIIPDHISVQVLDEKPDQFFLVLPKIGGPKADS